MGITGYGGSGVTVRWGKARILEKMHRHILSIDPLGCQSTYPLSLTPLSLSLYPCLYTFLKPLGGIAVHSTVRNSPDLIERHQSSCS